MSGPFADCYSLSPSRDANAALGFLSLFRPPVASDWVLSDPDALGLSEAVDLRSTLDHLAVQEDVAHYMSFPVVGAAAFAILAYNEDGSLVIGVSCENTEPLVQFWLSKLQGWSGSAAYAGVEEAPAASKAEFVARLGHTPNNSSKPTPLRGAA